MQLINPSGNGNVSLIQPAATLTIANDDSATISINNPMVLESNSGTASLVFSVSIDKLADADVSLTANTSDGLTNPATLADNDYVAVTGGTVKFVAGSMASQTVKETVNGDFTLELDEQLQLLLSSLNAQGRSVQFTGNAMSLSLSN